MDIARAAWARLTFTRNGNQSTLISLTGCSAHKSIAANSAADHQSQQRLCAVVLRLRGLGALIALALHSFTRLRKLAARELLPRRRLSFCRRVHAKLPKQVAQFVSRVFNLLAGRSAAGVARSRVIVQEHRTV